MAFFGLFGKKRGSDNRVSEKSKKFASKQVKNSANIGKIHRVKDKIKKSGAEDKNELSKGQKKSLELIEKKEKKVLEKIGWSKAHPMILKKLEEKKGEIQKIERELKRKSKRGKNSFKDNKSNGKIKKDSSHIKGVDIVGEDGSRYFRTFVPGFDELVNPGLPTGSAILVEGGPGSGKTLWCLTMIREMCQRGKKVLFMSFEEPEERLRTHINSFGLNSAEYEKKGLLYLKRFNALDIARSVEALLSEAKKELLIDVQPVLIPPEFKPDIVVVDSLSSISSAFSGESSRFRIYMEQLFRYLEGHNITSFLVREVASPTHLGTAGGDGTGEAVSFLSDGIIAIYSVIYDTGIRKRAMEILKMRGVGIDRRIVEYKITPKGVVIASKKTLKGKYTLT